MRTWLTLKRGCGVDNVAIIVKLVPLGGGNWALHCDQRKGHLSIRPLLSRIPGASVFKALP